jgi:hypothetical protein
MTSLRISWLQAQGPVENQGVRVKWIVPYVWVAGGLQLLVASANVFAANVPLPRSIEGKPLKTLPKERLR